MTKIAPHRDVHMGGATAANLRERWANGESAIFPRSWRFRPEVVRR